MGRYTRITCDVCGKDIYGQDYYTVTLRKISHGNQVKIPTMWVCRECMFKTQLLFAQPIKEMSEVDKND